jgi:hypothetical protein
MVLLLWLKVRQASYHMIDHRLQGTIMHSCDFLNFLQVGLGSLKRGRYSLRRREGVSLSFVHALQLCI